MIYKFLMKKTALTIILILAFLHLSCQKNTQKTNNQVVIGITSDIQTLSPVYAFSLNEGTIMDLMYLDLFEPKWNAEKSDLELKPMLAKDWMWNKDSTSITLDLRNDVYWSDSVKFTAQDVIFTFDLYSDPVVQSRFFGTFQNLYQGKDYHINIKKSFQELSPYKLKINFVSKYSPDLFELACPILPKHIYDKLNRKNLSSSDVNDKPVTDGPFTLGSWQRGQSLILKSNPNSYLHKKNSISRLIFKVVPDYNSRLNQLKTGEIDVMELIRPEDKNDLGNQIKIVPVKGREYEYIGWNNISVEDFAKGKIEPNKFFGDKNVRKALTYAINRKEILSQYLLGNGEISVSPVTPIFKSDIDTSIQPYEYNVDKAKQLLAASGWKDSNNDGILDKNGLKFSFTLNIPSGNPRREYEATVIKNNLKEVGIEVNVQTLEPSTFFDELQKKQFNAWIASWLIALPIDFKPFWYSDLNNYVFNVSNYQNKKVDQILDELETRIPQATKIKLYKEFENIIHNDEPATFMFWMDDIVGYNKRIKNIEIDPLGVVQYCWNWTVKNE